MKKNNISIIGHFGGKEELLDGQTVKTKILYQELREKTDWNIYKVDTYYRRKNPVKLLCQTLFALLTTKDVIVILSQNGRRVYFPVLYFFAKVFHTRVYHDVIGGRLAKYTEEYPAFRKYMNAFQVNWIETSRVKADLEKAGIVNVQVLPNFKRLQIVSPNEKICPADGVYRLCTFSRVMQEKGIEDAACAVQMVNERLGRTVFSLDIYGPVDPDQKEWFEGFQKRTPNYVRYCGSVHYGDSVDTLKQYFALLFPTRFFSEGIPGTIIDAYAAGVPVIASRWESFSDVIDHGRTGYGYPFMDTDALVQLLIQIAETPELISGLSEKCTQKAEDFLPDKSVSVILDTICAAQRKADQSTH